MIRRARIKARPVALVVALVAVTAFACGDQSESSESSGSLEEDALFDIAADASAERGSQGADGPLVVAGPPVVNAAPGADPTTPLGQVRARHLLVWSAELDWAFPPQVCDSAWELDAIAAPDPAAEASRLDDLPTSAALAVMRYEYLYSRALHDPRPLVQLCVAVGSVDPIRSENLAVLASYLSGGMSRREPPAHPQQVTVLAAGASGMLAVACVAPGYPTVVADGEVVDAPSAPVRLQAYLLSLARGIEDAVADVSLRVSQAAHRSAQSCDELGAWKTEWQSHVRDWIAEGRIWEPLDATINVDQVCRPRSPDVPTDCPDNWPA